MFLGHEFIYHWLVSVCMLSCQKALLFSWLIIHIMILIHMQHRAKVLGFRGGDKQLVCIFSLLSNSSNIFGTSLFLQRSLFTGKYPPAAETTFSDL